MFYCSQGAFATLDAVERTPSSSELAGAPVASDNGRINMQSAN